MKCTDHYPISWRLILFAFFLLFLSCNEEPKDINKSVIVNKPAEIDVRAEDIIHQTVKDILRKKQINDSMQLRHPLHMEALYGVQSYQPLWTSKGQFTEKGYSLFNWIENARYYGLFPEDYQYTKISAIRNQLITDTASRNKLDASKWAYADLMLSSAFVQLLQDVKLGRLLPDSVIQKDTTLSPPFIIQEWNRFKNTTVLDSFIVSLEPTHRDYRRLRQSLKSFVDSADFRKYSFIYVRDSSELPSLLAKRLREEDSLQSMPLYPDSKELSAAIKKYQKLNNLTVDGKITPALVNKLNDNDHERFIRIAINLDRYKSIAPLPEQFIWVNIPAFYLQVRENDSVVLSSRVAVGKSLTKTPLITSAISDMITYPQWTIPTSIINKEILPGLKSDPGYTIKRGYSILDTGGIVVDPYFVDWSQYKKTIPFKVIQGSGDDNALGILKFNFPNRHAVYLHDTNQRYLFSRKNRSLSHGCIRVESWRSLAHYILRSDSAASVFATPIDSLESWLMTKQKRVVPVRKKVPIFIRYFTTDVADGRIVFYEDIYNDDKLLRDKYFRNK